MIISPMPIPRIERMSHPSSTRLIPLSIPQDYGPWLPRCHTRSCYELFVQAPQIRA